MLTLKNLTVSVEKKVVVDHLSLSLKSGEIHALMGPNGSGKSSLASALMGHPHYQIAAASQVSLDNQNLLTKTPDQRAAAGLFLAFQYPLSIAGVSVYNFLKIAFESLHCATCPDHTKCPRLSVTQFRSQVNQLAETIDVSEKLLKRSLNEGFSGGEKKRLEVLQALLFKPRYAIFDETDSGLDIDAIKSVSQGIRHLVQTAHTGCLVITHYQRILKYLKPHQVSIMVAGNIVKTGGPALIKTIEASGYQNYKPTTVPQK